MVEPAKSWTARDAWSGIAAPGRFGAHGDGVVITLRTDLRLASLIVADGRPHGLAAAVKTRLGLNLPVRPGATYSAGFGLIWTGPSQWLLVAENTTGFSEALVTLSEHAAIADQSRSRAVLRLTGPRVRETLAKGCMIDLHPTVFLPGDAASTSIAHIGALIWRRDDAPASADAAFEMAVPRSMAGSFWSWLAASAAEFGATVLTEPDRPVVRS